MLNLPKPVDNACAFCLPRWAMDAQHCASRAASRGCFTINNECTTQNNHKIHNFTATSYMLQLYCNFLITFIFYCFNIWALNIINVIQVNSHEMLCSVLQARTKKGDMLPVWDLHGQASTVCGSELQSIPHTGRYLAAAGKCEHGCGLGT